eukprot:4864510-Alexandrium_andersonii.AAC.1
MCIRDSLPCGSAEPDDRRHSSRRTLKRMSNGTRAGARARKKARTAQRIPQARACEGTSSRARTRTSKRPREPPDET